VWWFPLAGCVEAPFAEEADEAAFSPGVTSAPAARPARFAGVLPGSAADDPEAVVPAAAVAHRLCVDAGEARSQLESRLRSSTPEAQEWSATLLFQPACETPSYCAWIEGHLAEGGVWWAGTWPCPSLEARVFEEGPDWLVRDWVVYRRAPWHPRLPAVLETTPEALFPSFLAGLGRSEDPRVRALAASRGLAGSGVPSREDLVEALREGLDPRDLPEQYPGFGAALGDELARCATDPDEAFAHACAVARVRADPARAAALAGTFPDLVVDPAAACVELGAAGFPCAPEASGPTAVDLLEASGHARRIRGFLGEPESANVYRLLAFADLPEADVDVLHPVDALDPDGLPAPRALLLWSGGRRFRVVEAFAPGDLRAAAAVVNAALAHAGRDQRLQLEASGVRVVKGTPAQLAALSATGRVTLLPFAEPAEPAAAEVPE
jgi:hypothetical protein